MTQQQATTILDPTALDNLREMLGGDDEFLSELIDTFLADAPQMLDSMRQGLKNGDAEILCRAAHSMKSNSTDFGATTLSELCRALEAETKTGALNEAEEKIARIEQEYSQVKAVLEAMRNDRA